MNTTVRQATEAGGPVGAPLVAPQVVLVPLLNMGLAEDMLGLAAHLTRDLGAVGVDPAAGLVRIVVLSVVEVPPDQPLTMGMDMARSYRALLDFLPSQVEFRAADSQQPRYVRVDRVVKVARNVAEAISQAAQEEHAELLLLYWKGHAREPKQHHYGQIVDSVLENPPCSVLLTRVEGWNRSRRILLSVRGGPSAEQALGMSVALAERLSLPVTVLHNVPRAATVPNLERNEVMSKVEALGEAPYLVFNEQLRRVREATNVPVESILTRMEDPVAAILSEAEPDDIVIMGMAPRISERKGSLAESLALRVAQVKGSPLLLLNVPSEVDMASYSKRLHSHRKNGRSRMDGKQWVDMPFEHWFVEHTYHGDEFRDPEEFLRAKQASGLSMSVVVLTSNDAGKIHSVVTGLRRVLQELHPLAEQIVVVDAGSTDGTPQIARELGAEVYRAADILPEQGALHGRGESWWKSLSVVKGDIVVWVDPRARRFHPSTVLALAGPLLRTPTLKLVKAYEGMKDETRKAREVEHRRHGSDEFSPVDMSWGGFVVPRRGDGEMSTQVRVQALRPSDLEALDAGQLAMLPPRTLFQVLCPSLAGVSAPFGKDMAARRDAMMTLPVMAGDGFEIGLLLSVATEYGTNTIAQVELGQGQPAAAPEPSLRGAVDLLQVMSSTLPDPGMRHYTEQIAERLRREIEGKRNPAPGGSDGVFEVRALGPVERAPMRLVLGEE